MIDDIVLEREALFLGTRLKRLGERMQADAQRAFEEAGLQVQPGQQPLLATLDRDGPQTIGALAEKMGVSQPGITRTVANLIELGLVETSKVHRDQRQKTISLTAAGEAIVGRSRHTVWPLIERAVTDLTGDLEGPLLQQIAAIEARLAEQPLHRRGSPALTIHEFSDALAPMFRDINAEWIEAMYRLEDTDREVLDNPRARIVDPGGTILFVEAAGLGIVGACALQQTSPGRFELTKMGVLEKARGRKAGEFLLAAMIERAWAMEAELLYLLTNRTSAAAIHLYQKLGFAHDAEIMRDYGLRYERCDVAMRYTGPLR